MRNRIDLIVISVLLLFLVGCASAPPAPPEQLTKPEEIPQNMAPQGETSPVETTQIEVPDAATPQVELPQPSDMGTITEPAPPVPEPVASSNPAIIALLDRARLDNQAGKREAAGTSLERALRIEPRNAWLWQELAQVRLTQGQYAQAISLAQKSISFSGREHRIQVLNWRLIGNARVAQGNPSEAEQAFKLAAELDQPAVPVQAAKPGQ